MERKRGRRGDCTVWSERVLAVGGIVAIIIIVIVIVPVAAMIVLIIMILTERE